jgi:hypothetical protein
MKRYIKILAVLSLSLIVTSCEDFFNVNPDDILLEKDYPSTVTELYSGYMGITAKVQAVADQAIFLEGLRGDFLEPTRNSTDDILDLYYYKEKNDNELADPSGYYAVILNANDYIQHATSFYAENPTSIDKATFEALISGSLRYKCWAYLMLAKIYGQAIWIDDPLDSYKSLSDYPLLTFDNLIQKCIDLIERGITINTVTVNGKSPLRWTDILGNSDLKWNRYCPPAACLLTELYLFAGNYEKTIENGFAVLKLGAEDSETKASFQITKSEWNGEWLHLFGEFYRTESIFLMYYDYDNKQTNRLIDYFSNNPACKYLMRPSQYAMDRFSNQTRLDGNEGDNYRGRDRTYNYLDGDWVVYKYTAARNSSDLIYRNDVPITLYRASDIHLWLAEALAHVPKRDALGGIVREARLQEAATLYDGGIESFYSPTAGMFTEPFEDFPTTLYSSSSDGSNQGIRGRVSLRKMADGLWRNSTTDINTNVFSMDSLLIEETCMESAGEARAYYAMMRIAKRWNKPEILAERVSAKYPEGMRQEIYNKLMNPENWFIRRELK